MRTLNWRFAIGLLVVLILFGIGTFFLHQYQYTRIADDIAGQCHQARAAGQKADAVRLAYHYLQFRPDDATMLEELGGWLEETAKSRKQVIGVVNLLDRSLQLQPQRNDLRRRVVALNLKVGRYGECLDHLDRLLPNHADDAELLAAFGVCKEAIGKPSEGAQALEKAWKIDPKRIATALDYAQLLQRHLGRPDEARKVLEEAAQQNPDHAGVRLGLARFFRATGKLADAEAAAKEAVQRAPKDANTLITAAEIFQAAGKISQARTTLQEAVTVAPDDTRIVCSLAWLLLYDGKIDQAIEQLRAAVRDKPTNADVLTLLGDILALDGRLDALEQVVADLQKVRRSAPERGWNADYLQARLLMRRGDWPKATVMLEELRLAAARNPNLAKQANFLLALCYDQFSDRPKEMECYRRILEADPQAGYFRLEYSRTLARAGQFAESTKEFRLAIQRPDLPPRTMAEVLNEIVDRAERHGAGQAIRDLEKSLVTVKADDSAFFQILSKVELGRLNHRSMEALNLATQYLAKHPNQTAMIVAHVRLLDQVHGVDRALAALQEAEQRLGDLADWRLLRIRMLSPRYQPQRRGTLLALADNMDKFTPEDRLAIYSELLLACQNTGDDTLVTESLQRFRTARPDHLPVRSISLTRALAANNDADTQQLLAELKTIEGDNGFAQRLYFAERALGRALTDPTGIAEAKSRLLELSKAMPGHPLVEFFLGRLSELADDNPAALQHYTTALNNNLLDQPIEEHFLALVRQDPNLRRCRVLIEQSPLPDRLRFEHDRCAIMAVLQMPAASLRPALADRILRGNPSAGSAHLVWFANQCQLLGLTRHAALALARATEQAPLSDEAWSARIGFYVQRQELAQVQELVVEAKSRIPAKESALVLARSLERSGLPADAVRQLQHTVGLQPVETNAGRQGIQQLLQSGRVDEARQQLTAMIDQQNADPIEQSWARRTLAMNLTLAPSLTAFQTSLKLLEANRSGSQYTTEDLRALAHVYAVQKSRMVDGIPARAKAKQILEELIGTKQHQSEDVILLARLYGSDGKVVEYQNALHRLNTDFPRQPAALAYLAGEALRAGDLASADRLVTDLETIEPNRFEGLALRTAVLTLQGHGDAAVQRLNQYIGAATAGPPRLAVMLRCGHAAWEILSTYPPSVQPQSQRALRQAAIGWYQQGLGRDPQALLRLVTLHCKEGRSDRAFDLMQTPAVRNNFSAEACAAATLTITRNGQTTEAQTKAVERQISDLLRRNPGSTALMLIQADFLDSQGQEAEALAIYRQVLSRDPNNIMALNNLAWTLSYNPDKMGEALQLIEDAIDRTGPLDELLDTRAKILFASGRRDEGLRDMVDAIATAPSATRFFYLSMMYRQAEQTDQAAAAWKRAREFGLTEKDVHPKDVGVLKEMMARN